MKWASTRQPGQLLQLQIVPEVLVDQLYNLFDPLLLRRLQLIGTASLTRLKARLHGVLNGSK